MKVERMDNPLLYIACLTLLLSAITAGEEVKPELITTANNDYFGFMDKFEGFKCQAKGTNLKYSWKHNDIIIDEKYILKFPKTNASTLQPLQENINPSYEGFYQCFVENSIGRIFGRKALVKFTIVGDFIKDQTETITVDVDVDKPYALHCPSHRTSQKVTYSWLYKQAGFTKQLPESDNYFVSDNGTLYFSILSKKDITFINDKEGILCQQQASAKGSGIVAKQSHRITFRENLGSGGTKTKEKPNIRTTFTDMTIDLDSTSLTIRCAATGYPIPELKWYRIDSITSAEPEIVESTDFKFDNFNQFLTIRNVNGGDKAGKYKCEAKNSEGTDSKSGRVIVAEYPQWMPNGEIQDIEPPLYSRLEWSCGAFGGANYNWYKNGDLISQRSPDGKVVVVNKDNRAYLIIKNVTATFRGMYQCTASNELDTIYSTARLKIVEKKPVFTEQMGPVTLILGREGIIACPVAGSPSPQITWRKNGQVILKVGKKDVKNVKGLTVRDEKHLILPNVTTDTSGTYTCYAENRNGYVEDSSEVTVGKDISWLHAPVSNRNVTITLRFELDCEASGDPSYSIKYRWLRNGLPLEYSARIHWVKEAHKLVILDAIVDDTGTYTCIASAETPLYIEKRKDVDIVVKAPANPPDLVWVVGSCWDDGQQNQRARLNWKVGSLNNEDVYEYWIDWSTTYDPTNWTRLPTVLEDVQRPIPLDFKLLPPFSQISFRVTVFNRIGAGEPSIPTDPSDCITRPAAPRFSPVMIKGVPGGPNTLTIEWTPVPQTFWGGPAFNYSVQWRRKTYDARGRSDDRWLSLPLAQNIRIHDGNNNSVPVRNPGYYVEWEFRIRSNNAKGSAPGWTYGTSFSGQDPPDDKPEELSPDRIAARSADISWAKVTAPKNGTITGYKIQFWHSGIGMDVEYDRNRNLSSLDLETINELEEDRAERYREKRSIEKRDLEARSKRHTVKLIPLTKRDNKASIVERYLSSLPRSLSKRDSEAQNVPRVRKKREDEDENVEKEEPLDLCFNPDEPCYQDAPEKESQLLELTPYKTYHVRIAAYNSGGLGPWSKELIFNTAEASPGQPYAVNTIAYDKYCKLTWKEPRHKNGKILQYEVYGKNIVRTTLPWWMRRHIIYDLEPGIIYEAKLRAKTSAGWGIPVFRWFQTHDEPSKPAKPLLPEVVGYGEDGVNVTFMEPLPEEERKFGGEMDEDPWELRPVGGYELEKRGKGGYPEEFYVLYRPKGKKDDIKKTDKKRMYGPLDQTWIVIENLEMDTVYEFATVPVNSEGEGPQSDWAIGLTGGIVPRDQKLYWYQRDWFIALIIVFFAACFLLFTVVGTTLHLQTIYYEGAPKRRKDREREKIYEAEDVDGGFSEFTLKSARSSRSVVTSRSEAPPAYNSVVGSVSRHSGDFEEDEDSTDSDDEKHEVSTYYSDEKKVPLDDLDDDDEEESGLATFV